MLQRKLLLIVTILLCALPAQAQFHKVGHYIKTHKELLASDAIVALAFSADAGSSVHCQSVSLQCIETNSLVGKHPTERQTAAWTLLAVGGIITGNHLIWHFGKQAEPGAEHLIWLDTTAIAIMETFNVRSNVQTAEKLQSELRRRGMLQ